MTDDGKTVTAFAARNRQSTPGRLVELASAGVPTVLRAREGILRVGREAGNDVVLDDPFVSRVHLEVRILPSGVVIADLDTKNGTHFQGARIRELPVASEATLVLGRQCILRVRVTQEGVTEDDLGVVGQSATAQKLRSAIARIAPTQLTVLIEGETGTGKDVAARALHARSPRAQKPMVVFDCASVSPSLLASELFGHTRGAYTGATGASEGAFRRAQGSTLFLDEIGELPLELQPALLRALEARQVRPVGGESYLPVDVRIIAATNRNLEAEVEAGRFRKDLLFRLAVTRIKLPPLRARAEDVPSLADHFARALGATLSAGVRAELQTRSWPGNVRELRNMVERSVMFAGGPGVTVHSLDEMLDETEDEEFATVEEAPVPVELAGPVSPSTTLVPGSVRVGPAQASGMSFQDAKQAAVESFEKEYLLRLIREADFNLSEAARRSGVDRRYLRELYKKHGIDLAQLRAGIAGKG